MRFSQVLEEKNTQIKVQQDQINTLKDKIKELQAASKKAAAEQEEEDIIKEKSPTKRPTGSRNLEEAEIKNTGNMIKSVARTSVRFGARRDM